MQLPNTAVLELTALCNHKCFFCCCPWEYSVEKPNKELSTSEWKKAIQLYRFYGVNHFTFTGGEAVLRKDLSELIQFTYSLGCSIGVVSNGYAVTDNLLETFMKFDVLLSISVPGIETFEANTGLNNIENVLNLFEKCKKIGVKTVANIAVSKSNFNELYENISYPIMRGADYILLNRFLPGGRGMNYKEKLLSIDEINEMLNIAEEILNRSGLNGHIGTELPYCIIKEPNKYKRLQVASTCGAAKGFFVTDPEGNVKTCNHSPNKLCKWNEVASLESNKYWKIFTERTYYPKMCEGCKHINICDGGCREAANVANGAVNANDPCFGINSQKFANLPIA